MYGVITTVPAPIEMYDGIHAEMIKRVGMSVNGLLVHIGRATTGGVGAPGFQPRARPAQPPEATACRAAFFTYQRSRLMLTAGM